MHDALSITHNFISNNALIHNALDVLLRNYMDCYYMIILLQPPLHLVALSHHYVTENGLHAHQ